MNTRKLNLEVIDLLFAFVEFLSEFGTTIFLFAGLKYIF